MNRMERRTTFFSRGFSVGTFVLAAVAIQGCTDPGPETKEDLGGCRDCEELVLRSSTACGWGAGSDSLKIVSGRLRYYHKCMNGAPEREFALSSEDWNRLLSVIDLQAFETLDLKKCRTCFDGCHVSISITKGEYYHKVTLGYAPLPEEIADLVSQLRGLRMSWKEEACGP